MKSSHYLYHLIFLIALTTSFVSAADKGAKYVGTLSGVECTACKRTIAKALSKLDGVKTIRIVKHGENKHRLEVLTGDSSNLLTKSDATKALKDAKHYKILSWSKVEN